MLRGNGNSVNACYGTLGHERQAPKARPFSRNMIESLASVVQLPSIQAHRSIMFNVAIAYSLPFLMNGNHQIVHCQEGIVRHAL